MLVFTTTLISLFAIFLSFNSVSGELDHSKKLPNEAVNITFEDVAWEKGLRRLRPTWGISWADFNHDGFPRFVYV